MTSYVVHSETGKAGQIHEAMAAVLDECPAVGKDQSNQALNFKFRGIQPVLDALNPLLGKHGVVPVLAASQLLHWEPKTKGYAAVVLNTWRFMARDGSFIEAVAVGEGHDFGDKAVSKANTMAFKTCLVQTFALAFEDDPDGESVVEEPKKAPKATRAAKAAPSSSPPQPPSPPGDVVAGEVEAKKLRDDAVALKVKVDGLSGEEISKLKNWLLATEAPGSGIGHAKFDQFTRHQLDLVAMYVEDEFGDPF